MLRRRRSSGSYPARRAAMSIMISRATVSIIHGPRYAPRRDVFVITLVLEPPTFATL